MKLRILSAIFSLFVTFSSWAQRVTSSPIPLQEDSPDVKIYFNASGTPLQNFNANDMVFAHTGCNLNTGQTWVSAPTWGNNAEKYRLTYQGNSIWMLYIGDIRQYYGITNPTQQVTGLNFVFRSGDTRTQTDDLYIAVYDGGLQINLAASTTDNVLSPGSASVTFTASTTQQARITLAVNGATVSTVNNSNSLVYTHQFTTVGDYEVTATAQSNDATVSSTLNYVYIAESQKVDYPGSKPKMGPVKNADGSVTFCIAAPEKDNVLLVGAWNDYKLTASQLMNYQDVTLTDQQSGNQYIARYFWITMTGLSNTEQYGYYFSVDGVNVGDPYARLVLDPFNDKYIDTDVFPNLPEYPFDKVEQVPLAIYQGDINDYNWVVKDFEGVAPNNLIIYELLLRDFTGTEGKANGNGTVRQAIEKLPYLIELGVNAVELLPIMDFEGNLSWGYNPNFYFAPDKAYGTPDDYKEFIDLCHQNGIAVILDMVFNQSSGLHPWYQMYGGTVNSPFYNSGFGGENGAPHAYSVLNDWNQGYPLVQQQWEDVIEYWMTEYKFDGFRFDLVKGLGNNDSYANASDAATNQYNASRIARMKSLKKIVDAINPKAYFINENLAYAQEENAMAADGELNWANVNYAGCQFAMGYTDGADLNRMYAPLDDKRLWGSTVSYLESHDEQRLAYKQERWGATGVKGNHAVSMRRLGAAAAQMIMAPGAHMIWQFSEMGNAENTKDNGGSGSGNLTGNKMVNWNLLEDPDNYALYKNYCDLIALRNGNPDLFDESAGFEMACAASDWTKGRYLYSWTDDRDKECYTLINPNIKEIVTISNVPFGTKDNNHYYIPVQSYEMDATFNAAAGTVTVPPNSFVVVATKEKVSGIDDVEHGSTISAIKAYSSGGNLTITDAPDRVTVYTVDGVFVATLRVGESTNVVPGLYVLVSGTESLKMFAR